MALIYTTYEDTSGGLQGGGDVTTASRSYTAGQLVMVLWATASHEPGAGTTSVANSGTAQTWNDIADHFGTDDCYVQGWWCVMSTTQSMTITCASDNTAVTYGVVHTIVHAGQHATTPVPVGKISSGIDADGDYSVSITPTATGSALWLFAADWGATDSYAAAANCTLQDTYHVGGQFTVALVRPTTQPRADANAFTIGETDTAGKISYIAFEVVAAAGAAYTPRTMLLGVG